MGEKKAVQARFLLGPAGSGKTFRCLAEIRAALAASPEGPPLVLLAPKQATFQLERQLLAGSALTGYTRLNIFSFERLARFVLDTLGVPMPSGLLAEEGRVMVLRALLLRHENELKLFRPSAHRPGFAQQLSQLLGELQQHQFTPARLRALSTRPDLRRELQDKLHDLALLFEAYAHWLAKNELQDGNRLLDAATDALREIGVAASRQSAAISLKKCGGLPTAATIQHLWLDGFAEMTPQELDVLAAIVPRCDRTTLAFCLASEPAAETSWLSIWSSIGKTFQQCRQRLSNAPDCDVSIEILKRDPGKNRFIKPALRQMEMRWQGGSGFQLDSDKQDACSTLGNELRVAACANPEAEAVFAAREILKFVHDNHAGNRFRDAAVLVRSLDGYHKPLERAFRRYGIPFFLDRREFVAHHPLAELTRSALRTVTFDWPHDDWFAALKAGFSPVDEADIDRLENEALARGWHGAKWREPVQIAENAELEKFLERLRENNFAALSKFCRATGALEKQADGHATGRTRCENFGDEIGVEKTLENWSLAGLEKSSIVNRQSSIHQTVWEQMKAWLDNVALAFADEALALRDWLPILEAGLANLTVGVIPPALDQVLIGAIDRARNPDLKLALVLGVNESVFPAAPAAPVILTDADRDEMRHHAGAPGPDLRERLARERFLGYIACTRASEKLVVTFSRQDADGRTLNPSPFIAHLRRILPGLDIEESSGEIKLADAEHVSDADAAARKSSSQKSAASGQLCSRRWVNGRSIC